MSQGDEAGRHWVSADTFHQDILVTVDSADYGTTTGGPRTVMDSAQQRGWRRSLPASALMN